MAILGVGLTPEQLERRRAGVGGSDACILMSGDSERIIHLWRIKRGEAENDDLSDVLPVQMGQWTEPLNIFWFQKKTGFHVKQIGLECAHESIPFMICTLDGVAATSDGDAVLECKHVNVFNYSMEKIITDYYPQLQHNMLVSGLSSCAVSVFVGNLSWYWEMIQEDKSYQKLLIDREKEFWECVKSGNEPLSLCEIKPDIPVKPGTEIIDMFGDNEFGAAASDYLKSIAYAKLNKISVEKLKTKIPNHAGGARGYGVVAKRLKNGSIRVRKETDD